MAAPEITMMPAGAARRVLRYTLAMRRQSPAELERQVNTFLEYARALSLDLSRQSGPQPRAAVLHWACLDGERIVAAGSCLESPGRTAMLFLRDGGLAEADAATLARLVEHAVAAESKRDVCLLQCLLHPEDESNAGVLRRGGFREIATLLYLERRVASGLTPMDAGPPAALGDCSLQWRTYEDPRHVSQPRAAVPHQRFADLILATYQDSLDCPALTGLRHVDDVIAGHQAVGLFNPEHWLLLECDGQVAGCVLLVESVLHGALELTYMGVHPSWRRRGVGGLLLSRALRLARGEEFDSVTLAVDAANVPALRLYDSFGFRETTRRRAWLRPLQSTSCG